MRVTRRLSPARGAATPVVLALVMLSVAQAAQEDARSKITIKNFGCVNPNYYRGAQPKGNDYADLAALGVRTVIDLQREGDSNEQQMVEAAGMKFVRIGMSDKSRPAAEQVEEFLRIVNDPANQPVFVHCRGGRHRTGALTATYRITRDGWTAEQAYQEMKQFDFNYGFGHGSLKDYVYDYYASLEQKGVVVNTGNK